MIVQLVLLFCLSVVATIDRSLADTDSDKSDTYELGKGVNLRKISLLSDFQEREASVFEALPSTCFKKTDLHYSGSHFDYYANTKAFYSKTAVTAGLDVPLQSAFTLGATLSSVIQKTDSEKNKVSGISLNVRALTEKILVNKDCLDDDEISKLTKRLLKDFEILPLRFAEPWLGNAWKPYHDFLEKMVSLGQKLNVPKTCKKILYKHIKVVPCRKQLEI